VNCRQRRWPAIDGRSGPPVDIGQIVWVEVTPEAADELSLAPGSEVTCLLKAHSLRLVT